MEFTKYSFLASSTIKTQIIYSTVLLAVVAVFVALPFIYFDVTVQAEGLIRPVAEKAEIQLLSSGFAEKIYVSEGVTLKKGDTILVLNNEIPNQKIEFLNYKTKLNSNLLADIHLLLKKEAIKQPQTAQYKQFQAKYLQQKAEINRKLQKAEKELKRNKQLFEKGGISEKEFDDLQYSYELLAAELNIFNESYFSSLQQTLLTTQNEQKQLLSELSQLQKEKENRTIQAPVSGTLEQFSGIYQGSNIQQGQTLAVISPTSELIAEVYVSPKDIAYIGASSQAKVQVHAFNYTDWGFLNATVLHISDDFIMVENQPFFRVKCALSQNYLELKNGFRGKLKKGMTLRTRFLVTSRSAWQLIFDDFNDWLNPAQDTQ